MARDTRASSSRRDHRRDDEQRSAQRWRLVGAAAALVALTVAAYLPVFRADFVMFDDMEHVVQLPAYNPPSLGNLVGFWTEAPGLYTPVLWTVWGLLAFVARTEGPGGVLWDATAYHAFNLLAHAGAGVMAMLVLRRLVPSLWAAFIGAAVFALHPLQVESVAWVSGMKTPLSGLFALWATWHALRFSEIAADPPDGDDARRRGLAAHLALGTAAFAIALITKPTVVVLPLIIALVEFLIRRRRVRDLWPMAAWLALSVAFGMINVGAQTAAAVYRPTVGQRLVVTLDSLSFYLAKLAWPVNLLPDYSRTPEWLVSRPGWWLGAVPAAIVLLLAAACIRRAPWLAASGAVFALGVATTLGFIRFDYQIYSTVADRYAYLSMFGAAIAAAFVAYRVSQSHRRRQWAIGLTSCVLLAFAALTFRQCLVWRNSDVLFDYTLKHNPRSLVAYRGLTFQAMMNGEWNAAGDLVQRGLQARPHDPVLLQVRGNVAVQRGRFDEAAAAFRAASEQPSEVRHIALASLGAALAQNGDLAGAERAFEDALQIDPEFATAHENLGVLNAQRGRWDAALHHFSQAVRIDPNLTRSATLIQQIQAMRSAGRLPTTTTTLPATSPARP